MKINFVKNIARFLSLLFIATIFSVGAVFAEDTCKYAKESSDIISSVRNCAPEQAMHLNSSAGWLDSSKERIVEIINQLIAVGSVISMGGIAYASMMFATASGDDGKVTKAKEAAKYGVGGFVVMIMASAIVNALVNLLFKLG